MSLCGQAGRGQGSLRDPRGVSREDSSPFCTALVKVFLSPRTAHSSLHPSPSGFRVSVLTVFSGSTGLVQALILSSLVALAATSLTPFSPVSTGDLIMTLPYFKTFDGSPLPSE